MKAFSRKQIKAFKELVSNDIIQITYSSIIDMYSYRCHSTTSLENDPCYTCCLLPECSKFGNERAFSNMIKYKIIPNYPEKLI